MEGREDTGWGGGGWASPPGSVVRFDPRASGGGGAARITVPREEVAVGTGDPSVLTDMGPQVSVVLIEETGVRCVGN